MTDIYHGFNVGDRVFTDEFQETENGTITALFRLVRQDGKGHETPMATVQEDDGTSNDYLICSLSRRVKP